MKQIEHIYENTNTLKTFIDDNKVNDLCLIQVYSQNKAQALKVKQELEALCKNMNVSLVVSCEIAQITVNFTILPSDAEIINHDVPIEFGFFHAGPVVIFKREPKDDCWLVTHVTRSVSQWGYEPEYFLDSEEAVKNVFYKEDMQRVRNTLAQHIKEGAIKINQQYRINKADGTIAWISDYTQVIYNTKGEPTELIGYLVDITQDKDHTALYEGIVNTTTEGFWLLDAELRIIDVNYSLCAMLGYTRDEMIGRKPLEFIASRDHSICTTQAALINDISSRIYEIAYKTKSGGTFHTLTSATTMYDQDGNMKTFAFMTDISIQKRTEEDLRKRQDDIEELNNSLESRIRQEVEKNREKEQMMYQQSRLASMGEMIGNIAHQWRQPLNIMALVMQDLYISDQLGNLTSKKVEESYEKSNNLLQYMSQTIDDFRNFFKQDAENLEFSIKEALESVYGLINTNLSYHHVECNIDMHKDSIIKGGLNAFKQVLINIINNAQEAILSNNSKDKKISILITQENGRAIVRIGDDGGGIKKSVINKIFDPYFTTKNQTQGTGLGLYMSRQIIENSMCGSLSAKNTGVGAEFTISLSIKEVGV